MKVVIFDYVQIRPSFFPEDNAHRTPPEQVTLYPVHRIMMYTIGKRVSLIRQTAATDVELAYNLGCKAIFLQKDSTLY